MTENTDEVGLINTFTAGSRGGVVYVEYREQLPNVQIAQGLLTEDSRVVFGVSNAPATFYPVQGAVQTVFDTDKVRPIGPLLSLTLPLKAIKLNLESGPNPPVSEALVFTPAFDHEKIGQRVEMGAEFRIVLDDGKEVFLGIIGSSLEEAVVLYNSQISHVLSGASATNITITLQPVDISEAHKRFNVPELHGVVKLQAQNEDQ